VHARKAKVKIIPETKQFFLRKIHQKGQKRPKGLENSVFPPYKFGKTTIFHCLNGDIEQKPRKHFDGASI